MPLALDLEAYAAEAEAFVGAMDREYYLHFAGHKAELAIEPIYDRHQGLFERARLDVLDAELNPLHAEVTDQIGRAHV